MLPEFYFSDISCYETGQDFVYRWQPVTDAAENAGMNFATFITDPIAAKLVEKNLVKPILFLYTPLNDIFIITVCSKRDVNFMDPLHNLAGYFEYGRNVVRPIATPIVYWDGAEVFHMHPTHGQDTFHNYVADYGNSFGCTVTNAPEDAYKRIANNPAKHFDYFAVPNTSEQKKEYKGKIFTIKHAVCRMGVKFP